MNFEWDERKALINQDKHGVSFQEARTVFYDAYGLIIPDPDHSELEDRFLILGRSESLRLLVVCHCYRQDDQTIRLISARKATKHESGYYRAGRRGL
ncbi:BrnT family toxin [Marinobacter shengliensis]|uniref:BrnT family toxin n=1 Tax=Marinobacter shengliensis TaxID=1389223 RepID=UPI000D0F19B5|nr:BrnT family toxin [Marinobacter shengliensis]PSF14224.1 hypothetical protein C7H10_05895 [Marinobacter shengliensis]